MSTPNVQPITLVKIETDVARELRFRGASTDGQQAIEMAEQIVAAAGEALGAPRAVAGSRPTIDRSVHYTTRDIGLFGAIITSTTEHKYAFAARLTGAHGIDVTATFFLIPREGQWLYALDFGSRGIDFATPLDLTPVVEGVIRALYQAALMQARGQTSAR